VRGGLDKQCPMNLSRASIAPPAAPPQFPLQNLHLLHRCAQWKGYLLVKKPTRRRVRTCKPHQSRKVRSQRIKPLTNPSTLRNQLSSPLLKLPAELRAEIYKYVLQKAHGIYKFSYPFFKVTHHPLDILLSCPTLEWAHEIPNSFALLYTCRQLHHETRLLPFSHNSFNFSVHRACELLARLTSKQISAIKAITFTFLLSPTGRLTEARYYMCGRVRLVEKVHVEWVRELKGLEVISLRLYFEDDVKRAIPSTAGEEFKG
jgi:hypothetical protein